MVLEEDDSRAEGAGLDEFEIHPTALIGFREPGDELGGCGSNLLLVPQQEVPAG